MSLDSPLIRIFNLSLALENLWSFGMDIKADFNFDAADSNLHIPTPPFTVFIRIARSHFVANETYFCKLWCIAGHWTSSWWNIWIFRKLKFDFIIISTNCLLFKFFTERFLWKITLTFETFMSFTKGFLFTIYFSMDLCKFKIRMSWFKWQIVPCSGMILNWSSSGFCN